MLDHLTSANASDARNHRAIGGLGAPILVQEEERDFAHVVAGAKLSAKSCNDRPGRAEPAAFLIPAGAVAALPHHLPERDPPDEPHHTISFAGEVIQAISENEHGVDREVREWLSEGSSVEPFSITPPQHD